MQPAAKKCLWWAGASALIGVVLQVFTTAIMNALYDTWITGSVLADIPGWVPVMNSVLTVVTQMPLLIAAALIGAAVVVNVLLPRIKATRADNAADPQQQHAEDLPVSDRRDAVGIADASVYEPPNS